MSNLTKVDNFRMIPFYIWKEDIRNCSHRFPKILSRIFDLWGWTIVSLPQSDIRRITETSEYYNIESRGEFPGMSVVDSSSLRVFVRRIQPVALGSCRWDSMRRFSWTRRRCGWPYIDWQNTKYCHHPIHCLWVNRVRPIYSNDLKRALCIMATLSTSSQATQI